MTRLPLIRHAGLPILAALWLLTACSHEPPRGFGRQGPASLSVSEKAVIRALSQVDASEQQRRDVLAAFDREAAERKRFVTEAEALDREINRLSKKQPDYLARLEPLARRKGQLVTEQLLIQARFDQAVLATLTPEQLERWDEQFRPAGPGAEGFGPGGGGGGGRRRGGGGMGVSL